MAWDRSTIETATTSAQSPAVAGDGMGTAWRTWLADAALVAGKDLRVEWRTRGMTSIFLVFALLVMTALALAFPAERIDPALLGTGALWISLLFGALLSLGRSFASEVEWEAIDAFRMSPAAPSALFAGKLTANFATLAVLELPLLAVFLVFYNQPVDWRVLHLAGVLAIGTFGLCCVGTLLVAVNALVRGNPLLLPLLVVPLALPLVIAAVRCSHLIYSPTAQAGWASVRFLIVYAVLFLAAANVLFDYVLED